MEGLFTEVNASVHLQGQSKSFRKTLGAARQSLQMWDHDTQLRGTPDFADLWGSGVVRVTWPVQGGNGWLVVSVVISESIKLDHMVEATAKSARRRRGRMGEAAPPRPVSSKMVPQKARPVCTLPSWPVWMPPALCPALPAVHERLPAAWWSQGWSLWMGTGNKPGHFLQKLRLQPMSSLSQASETWQSSGQKRLSHIPPLESLVFLSYQKRDLKLVAVGHGCMYVIMGVW